MDTRMQDQANVSSDLQDFQDGTAEQSNYSSDELQKELAKWRARVPKRAVWYSVEAR